MNNRQVKINARGFRKLEEESFGKVRELAEITVEMSKEQSVAGGYSPKEPYDTGNNKDTIKMRQTKAGQFIVFTESGYGGWLHIGTKKMPPRPYIRDGYYKAKQALK